jgi:hypothetical protein
MKLNVWIVSALAPLTAVMLLAQDSSPTPAPGAPAPAPETAPAAAKKKPSRIRKKVVLNPPAAATVNKNNVNVRGQASFRGEVLGHLQKGGTVAVLEQITLNRAAANDEPAEWARIAMPSDIPVWVKDDYVDAASKTVKARRVHLRGGPGENYSVVGLLEKGAAIKEIKREKGWVAVEAPTNAYAFVAAEFLDMQPPPAPVVTPPAPAPAPPVVNVATPEPPVAATNEPAVVAPAPAPEPVVAPAPAQTDQELEALRHAIAAAPAPVSPPSESAATNEPAPPRIVTREGFVRRAFNIQASSDFELHDIQSGTLIDYLEPQPGQNFKIFVGTRVTVTGPEGMDPRWPRTPVLKVQSVDLMP